MLMTQVLADAYHCEASIEDSEALMAAAVAAAAASIKDPHYVSDVARKVASEREIWFQLLRELRVNATASSGNFVFFETRMPHVDFAASLLKEGVDIGRAFPPYDRWARISIGLPEENAFARAAVRKVLTARD